MQEIWGANIWCEEGLKSPGGWGGRSFWQWLASGRDLNEECYVHQISLTGHMHAKVKSWLVHRGSFPSSQCSTHDPFSPSLGCLSHPGFSISLFSAATQCFPSKFFCRSELLVHVVLQGQDWHTPRSYLKQTGFNTCTRLDLWVGVRKAMISKLDSLLLRRSNDARFSAADVAVMPLAQAAPPGCTGSKSVTKINSSTS